MLLVRERILQSSEHHLSDPDDGNQDRAASPPSLFFYLIHGTPLCQMLGTGMASIIILHV